MENIEWIFFDIGGVILDDSSPERLRQEKMLSTVMRYRPNISMSEIKTAWNESSKIPGSVRENALRLLLPEEQDYTLALSEYKEMLPPDHYFAMSTIRPESKPILEKLSRNYKLGIIANQSSKILHKSEATPDYTVTNLTELLDLFVKP